MAFAAGRVDGRTQAARKVGDEHVLLSAPDVHALLEAGRGSATESSGAISDQDVVLAPVIPKPSKVFRVGLSYVSHLREIRSDQPLPGHPTLFTKWAGTLTGHNDNVPIPASSITRTIDWEAELAVAMESSLYRAGEDEALDAIGGSTIANDISMTDWQIRTSEWLQGEAREATTPLGPELARSEEVAGASRDLVFDILDQSFQLLADGRRRKRLRQVREYVDDTWLTWIGGTKESRPFYFRIQSPVVFGEFHHRSGVWLSNETPATFRIHTIVRSPNGNDYGHAIRSR